MSCGKSCWYQYTLCQWTMVKLLVSGPISPRPMVWVMVAGHDLSMTYGMRMCMRVYVYVFVLVNVYVCVLCEFECLRVCVCACVRTGRHEKYMLFTWTQWGPRGLLHKSVGFHYIQTTRDQETVKPEDKTNNSARGTIARAHITRGTYKWKWTREEERGQ